MKYKEAVEIDKVEAFEVCGCVLPTKNEEQLIVRQVGHPLGNEVVFKHGRKYFIAPFKQ